MGAPSETSDFSFGERFMAARHGKECYEQKMSPHIKCCLVREALPNDDVGVAWDTVKEIRLVSNPAISLNIN